jgi:DNA-binding response OmpR family regulator
MDSAHILVVDDEREICELLMDYLGGEGYRVSVAHDGPAMRRIIGEAPVDIVLLDVVLPGEDGLALARWLRSNNPTVGIIMLTGRCDPIDRIVGLELGADDYLAKPFHLRELLARVKSVGRRVVQVAGELSADERQTYFAGWRLDLNAR